VVEFILGRYCATIDEQEIQEGLAIVQRQLSERTVRAGNEELIKSAVCEKGQVRIIDVIAARLNAKTASYVAELPSLKLRDVRISDELVKAHQRILTGGFYAEVSVGYAASIALEKGGRPFSVDGLRAIQLSQRDVLETMANARANFSTTERKDFLLRSIGIEPAQLTERGKDAMLLRMVSSVERNYNMVEIGPRGTGKSHLFQQVSPYAHLVSGGKATVARMFVNNANGQRGLVCQYDVVFFDEVSGISFNQQDGVNIMKGYMESGEFSRGKESIRADGSMVMVGNFEVDVTHQSNPWILQQSQPSAPFVRHGFHHGVQFVFPEGRQHQFGFHADAMAASAVSRRAGYTGWPDFNKPPAKSSPISPMPTITMGLFMVYYLLLILPGASAFGSATLCVYGNGQNTVLEQFNPSSIRPV
jgi:ATP-dependent Lon protease